jgi:hypothetical protein
LSVVQVVWKLRQAEHVARIREISNECNNWWGGGKVLLEAVSIRGARLQLGIVVFCWAFVSEVLKLLVLL